jgi:hypothetical protein
MARTDGKPEKGHYSPIVLLKNFTLGGKDGRLFVFDKHVGKVFPGPTSIKKICKEGGFYGAQTPRGLVSLEGPLSQLESDVDPVLQKVITEGTLSGLSLSDRSTLALFVAVQFLRVPRAEQVQREFRAALLEKARLISPGATNLSEFEEGLTRNAIKLSTLQQVADTALRLVPIILRHQWSVSSARGVRILGFRLPGSPSQRQDVRTLRECWVCRARHSDLCAH